MARNLATFASLLLLSTLSSVQSQPYTVSLTPWADDSIRIQIAGPGNTIADPPLMALIDSGPPSLTTKVSGDGVSSLTNGNLYVTVDPTTSLVTATRVSDGAVLLKQTGMIFGQPNVPVTRQNSYSAYVSFQGTPNEKIYGLGEHRTGTVQMSPYYKRFADSQDYAQSHGGDVSIPWYMSSLGYGFVWNLPSYGYTNLTENSLQWFSNATLTIDMWITTTSTEFNANTTSQYTQLLSNYVDAVGHAPTMPYYSTGFIQCKDRYRNQTQLLEVARGYVERQLPISVIVIDWQHWVNQGDWTFNPLCWPDPQGMYDELATLGIELMVTFWPFQTTGSSHWQEFSQDGYLTPLLNGTLLPYDGDQYLVDETNPYVRQSVFQGFWDGYGKYGIHTIWIDAAEPEHFGSDLEGQWKFTAGSDAEVGEAWIQQHAKTFQDGFATVGIKPEDYFILPRHAWAGSWRYSAALWSGDIQSSFDELSLQIRALQQVQLSGVALWTTDIGGYFGGDPTSAEFQELIVRWFQFGAFCPLFRLHGHRDGGPPSNECGPTNGDNEVWNLATDPDHYNSIVSVMRLRETLRNYVTRINQIASETGTPMIRPMFLQWPNDANCQTTTVEDQFMFGPDWLVAPQYTYQATTRNVYLPLLDENHTWIYYWNFSSVGQGGSFVTMNTPITEFPLFYIEPITPPPPISYMNATSFFSSERNDTVLCVTSQCYDANAPGEEGNYVTQRVEAMAILTEPENDQVVINGVTYNVVPLNLWFSFTHNDNIITTNSTTPDSTYLPANGGVNMENGYVLATQAPGTVPLTIWFKDYNGQDWDYCTVASAAGLQWVKANGYTNTGMTAGYVFAN